MRVHGYGSEELQFFHNILNRAVSEVAERGVPLAVFDMIQRLFAAADNEQRDPQHLRCAILRAGADIDVAA